MNTLTRLLWDFQSSGMFKTTQDWKPFCFLKAAGRSVQCFNISSSRIDRPSFYYSWALLAIQKQDVRKSQSCEPLTSLKITWSVKTLWLSVTSYTLLPDSIINDLYVYKPWVRTFYFLVINTAILKSPVSNRCEIVFNRIAAKVR